MQSPESIPLSQYRWLHVALSLPVALVFEIYFWVVGRLSKLEAPLGSLPLPSNAIVVLLHPEWPLFPPSLAMWKKITPKFCWVGLHHFFFLLRVVKLRFVLVPLFSVFPRR